MHFLQLSFFSLCDYREHLEQITTVSDTRNVGQVLRHSSVNPNRARKSKIRISAYTLLSLQKI